MTSMSPDELKVISRIQKLHQMAEGAKAVGSLAEAEAFMEGVERTLAKHNLASSVLTMDLRDHTDPLGVSSVWGSRKRHQSKPTRWTQYLAAAVAEAHYCVSLASITNSGIWFYGRQSNHETAKQMYVYLRDMAERLGWRAYRAYLAEGGHDANKWYLDWLEGFATEVSYRYARLRARVDSDRGMSLVRSKVNEEAAAFAKAFEASPEELEKDQTDKWTGTGRLSAQLAGMNAARHVNLRPNVVEGGETMERRALGDGGDAA